MRNPNRFIIRGGAPTNDEVTQAVNDLEAATSKQTTVADSAAVLIPQLNQLYKDALAQGGTPQQIVDRIRAVTVAIDAKADALQQAVTDNTPQATA